jgi:hypothetical protein
MTVVLKSEGVAVLCSAIGGTVDKEKVIPHPLSYW